ncbi:MAG: hypothetical protein WDW36_002794 [Sanguina aurantia]
MSGKGVKGGKGPPMGRPGAPIPGAKVVAAVPVTPVMETVKKPITFLGTAIVKKWPNRMDSLALLTEEQQQLGQRILPQPPPPPGDAAADASAPPAIPAVLRDFKQLGLPLDSRDITSLVHQSLSNAMGQHTHLRPFIFTNIFQSAPVVATYVASAMEAGYQWSRVERFFLSSIEMEDSIRGIKVQVRGRLGKKTGKASLKVWQFGEMSLRTISDAIDYGQAASLTRMGTIGIKVWIRYHDWAVKDIYYRKATGLSMPLSQLLNTPRKPLPYHSSSAWWNTPGPLQPLENCSWQAFSKAYDPTRHSVEAFLAQQQAAVKTFPNSAERALYLLDKSEGSSQPQAPSA